MSPSNPLNLLLLVHPHIWKSIYRPTDVMDTIKKKVDGWGLGGLGS